MTFSNDDTHVSTVCKTLTFLKVQDVHQLDLVQQVHKRLDGLLPRTYIAMFQRSSDVHNFNTNAIQAIKTIFFLVFTGHSIIGKK